MIKILILIAIAALTTSVGVLLSANKKKKSEIYCELAEFNEQLILNLKFERNSVKSVAANYKYISRLLEGEKILDGDDEKFIEEYFFNLGKTDAMSQIDYLNGRSATLLKKREQSQTDYKKYSSLYVKIFFLAGVLAAVLLV